MDRILPQPEVGAAVGMSGTTIWRAEKAGRFPRRRRIGPNMVGWLASEIAEYLQNLPLAADEVREAAK